MAVKTDKIQVQVISNSKQAINELGKLEMEAKELANQMKRAKRNTDEYNQASAKLKTVKKDIDAQRKALGLTGMTLRQLTRQQREYKNEISNTLTKGTLSYKTRIKQHQAVTKEIAKRRKELRGTQSFGKRFGAGFGKLSMAATGAAGLMLTLQGVFDGFAASIEKMGDLSDSIADVQKTTGLTRDEVEQLNQSFKRLDTRTSRKELLALAQIAGKLGVQGKENIEGFVKSADKLVVALGEDLGGDAEETIKQVGKLVDIFKVKDEFSLEEGLLKVGSAINSLGAASTASEGFLVDFSKRLGGIAPNAGISIQNILGLGATLDQLGQTTEVSATSLGQLLVKMGQEVPTFAKLAGLSVADFSKLLKEDANEALLQVIENSKSTTGGLEGMAETLNKLGIDGARSAQVIGVLSNNIDLVREQQALSNSEFEKGTSIMQEFNTKNQNFAAKIEKLKKSLMSIFVNSSIMKGLEVMVTSMNALFETHESLTAQITRETVEMNSLFAIIKDTNTSNELRKQTLEKINTTYGSYLPNLLTEQSTLEDIEIAQNAANKELVKNIILKTEKENIEKAIITAMEQQKSLLNENRGQNAEIINQEKILKKLQEDRTNMLNGGGLDIGILEATDRKIESAQMAIDAAKAQIKDINEISGIIAEGAILDGIQKRTDEMLKSFGLDRQVNRRKTDSSPDGTPTVGGTSEGGTGGGGGNTDAEYNALLEKFKAFNEKIADLDEENALRVKTRDEQDIARIRVKYRSLEKEAKKFEEKGVISEIELAGRLQDIRERHDEELNQYKKAKREREKQEAEDFRNEMKLLLATAQEQEILAIQAKYDLMIARAKKFQEVDLENKEEYAEQEKDLVKKKEAEIEATEKKHAEQRVENKKEEQIKKLEILSGTLNEFSGLITAFNELSAKQGEEGASYNKQLALFQLAIDTASAISAGVAMAIKNSHNPIQLIGSIVSITATIASSIGKAKKLLSAEPPEKPSFAIGGYTGDGIGSPDSSGFKPAGVVHEGEYVVPKFLLKNNQYVATQVEAIEALRLGRKPNFAEGGYASGPGSAMPMQDSKLTMVLIEEVRGLRTDVQNQKTAMRAYFTRDDFDDAVEFDDRIKQAEESSGL